MTNGTTTKSENIAALLDRVMASVAATFSMRGGTITVRFGTNDIRQPTKGSIGPYECWRVYESPAKRENCGHRHKSLKAVETCARSMASGEWSQSTGKSWVEILPWEDPRLVRAPAPVQLPGDVPSFADATHVRVERSAPSSADPTMTAYPFLALKKGST